ncbi:MAG: hypothetical protein LBR06_01455, partial [Bacteroidales bacterium]|nr:hypothetical protein [Bacteroidales bacterium]
TEIAFGIRYRRKVTDGQGEFGYSNSVQVFIVNPTTTPNVESGSNKGRDFWLTFTPTAAAYYALKIGADTTATVNFAFTDNSSLNTSITVTGGTLQTVTWNSGSAEMVATTAPAGVSSKTVHITSNKDIIVYAINRQLATTDATSVFPVPSWGSEYYHLGYGSSDFSLIVASQNNTHIYNSGSLVATLNAGQVYYFYSCPMGWHAVSDKPVAYYSSNNCTNVPSGAGYCDRLFEQLFSVDRWGTTFLVPQTVQTVTRIRIMCAHSGTNISQTGATLKTEGSSTLTGLGAGQWVELECVDPSGCSISSNYPVMVCVYMVGDLYSLNATNGDPAMGWVPPIEQKLSSITVARFAPIGTGANPDTHYALVVTQTSGKALTTVSQAGGPSSLLGGTWYDNAATGLSFCSYQLATDDYYTFTNPNGMVIGGYGIGDAESYYYLAGASSRVLTASLMVNGEYADQIAGNTYGECNLMTFECVSTDTPTSIVWRINGVEQIGHANQASWSANLTVNDYIIEMEAVIGDHTFTHITWFRVRCCEE